MIGAYSCLGSLTNATSTIITTLHLFFPCPEIPATTIVQLLESFDSTVESLKLSLLFCNKPDGFDTWGPQRRGCVSSSIHGMSEFFCLMVTNSTGTYRCREKTRSRWESWRIFLIVIVTRHHCVSIRSIGLYCWQWCLVHWWFSCSDAFIRSLDPIVSSLRQFSWEACEYSTKKRPCCYTSAHLIFRRVATWLSIIWQLRSVLLSS